MSDDAPETQAGPVVKVARDLTEIIAMYATLPDQAEAHGDNPDMPGGRAMVALGNVANVEAWENMQQASERYGRAYTSVTDEDPDESWSAFQLLEFWSEQWRAEHGAEYGQRPTIASEANFIRHSLQWAWDHELHWDEFAADMNRARVVLENVLYAGKRQEQTRVVCDRPTCERPEGERKPQLIRIYGRRYVNEWECVACTARIPEVRQCDECGARAKPGASDACRRTRKGKACEGRLVSVRSDEHCPACWAVAPPQPVWASNPDDDRHKCPSCKTRFDADDLLRARAKQLNSEGAERHVVLADAIGTLRTQGRAERTIRKWLEPPIWDQCERCRRTWKHQEYGSCPRSLGRERGACGGLLTTMIDGELVVEGYCEVSTHRTLVWWPDLWRRHLTTETRLRPSA
jgi:hypothetical protein